MQSFQLPSPRRAVDSVTSSGSDVGQYAQRIAGQGSLLEPWCPEYTRACSYRSCWPSVDKVYYLPGLSFQPLQQLSWCCMIQRHTIIGLLVQSVWHAMETSGDEAFLSDRTFQWLKDYLLVQRPDLCLYKASSFPTQDKRDIFLFYSLLIFLVPGHVHSIFAEQMGHDMKADPGLFCVTVVRFCGQ